MNNAKETFNTLTSIGTKRTMFNLFKQHILLFTIMEQHFPYLLYTDGEVNECITKNECYIECYKSLRTMASSSKTAIKIILRMIESDMFKCNKISKYCIQEDGKFIMNLSLPITTETFDDIMLIIADIELLVQRNRNVGENILYNIKNDL